MGDDFHKWIPNAACVVLLCLRPHAPAKQHKEELFYYQNIADSWVKTTPFTNKTSKNEGKKAAIDIVRGAVVLKIGKFKKTDISELCPSLSAASVERSLKALCKSGEIEMLGSGRSTFYVRKSL